MRVLVRTRLRFGSCFGLCFCSGAGFHAGVGRRGRCRRQRLTVLARWRWRRPIDRRRHCARFAATLIASLIAPFVDGTTTLDRTIQRLHLRRSRRGRRRGGLAIDVAAARPGGTRVNRGPFIADHADVALLVVARAGLDAGLQRLSGLLLEPAFAIGKRTLAGRRRRTHDHPALVRFARWARVRAGVRANQAAHTGGDRREARRLAVPDHAAVHAHDGRLYRLRIDEHVGRHRGDGVGHVAVAVVALRNVAVAAGVLVVDVVDDDVVDHRVAVVDLREIVAAGPVGRHVDFARAEREPANRGIATARDREVPAAAADEYHQRRRIRGALVARPRYPAPAVANARPTAVVRRREAPRGVVHPGPAPRLLPDPLAIAIRRPVRADPVRKPDVAVVRHRAPVAIAIEVRVADDIVAEEAQRCRAAVAQVARAAVAVEVVQARQAEHFVVAQVVVVEAHRVASAQREAVAIAIGDTRALRHHDRGAVVARVHIDAVIAHAVDHEGQLRRGNLEFLSRIEATHAQVDRAFRHFDLHEAIIQFQELDAGFLVHADERAADLQLRARIAVGPEAVAAHQRAVAMDVIPAVFAGR